MSNFSSYDALFFSIWQDFLFSYVTQKIKNAVNFARTSSRIAIFSLAGLGAEHVAEKTGLVNVKIDTMNLTPAQADMVRYDGRYDTEVLPPPKLKPIKKH
jgi:hypothetical protein